MSRIFLLLFFAIFGLCLSVSAQDAPEPQTLVPGQSVEREIAGGESHNYQIILTQGQFVRFRLEQQAIDAALVLSIPEGKQPVEMDLTRAGEQESLSWEATIPGAYRLTVRIRGAATQRGTYRLQTEVKTEASTQDRQRLTAEALLIESDELSKQGGKTAPQLIEKMQQALPIWRELDEPQWVEYSLSMIGIGYVNLGQYEQAIRYFEQELIVAREIKNRAGEGLALTSLGFTYYLSSRYEQAIEYLEQALAINREVKDRIGEGRVLSNLGLAARGLSRYEQAIEYYGQALAVRREMKDRAGEGVTLYNIGNVYRLLSRSEKAIEYYEQALLILREIKNQAGEAATLNGLGNAYVGLERSEKAIEYYEQALAFHRERKDRTNEAGTLNNLGTAYQTLNQYEKAIEYFDKALLILREIKNRAVEADTLSGLGTTYYKLKRNEKAIEYYEQALALRRQVKDRAGETSTLNSIARVARTQGNFPLAHTQIEESLKIIELLRADLLSPESRASYLASVQNSYQLYTDVLMQQHKAEPSKGFDALAVENSERQRARSLLDLLTEAHADARQGVDATLIERERALAKQLNDKAQTQVGTPEQADALKREISQLETDLERAQAAIRKANPRYAALVQPQPLKLKEIQAQLDADTLLLEYALGEDRSYLWAINRDSLTSYELPKEAQIKQSALQVYELLTARSTRARGETAQQRRDRISQAEAKLPAAAASLSQTLLAPVAAELGDKRLVIVADGALQYIPFAMLTEPAKGRQGDGETARATNPQSTIHNPQSPVPLIVGHEVVSLASASALAIQRAELAGRLPAPKLLAVIADPVFDRTDERFKTVAVGAGDTAQTQTIAYADARSIEHLAAKTDDKAGATIHRLIIPRLPFTHLEATRLLALAPKNSSFGAIDFQASRATVLKGDLGQYRYLHFATHGWLDSERPGLSSLVLSTIDEQGKPQNGFLRVNDIYNLRLPAELVVLSACQTGLGKEIKGEGLVGLTRGFMYAGAARVVVSLWNVNDKATADLMTKFYEKMLKQGVRPAAALRAAQVEMWQQKQWQSPYYWAAFTLQGEWR